MASGTPIFKALAQDTCTWRIMGLSKSGYKSLNWSYNLTRVELPYLYPEVLSPMIL